MIERKRYLELCQMNAVNWHSVKVMWNDSEYYPEKLIIWFDPSGATRNTASLVSVVGRSSVNVDIKSIREMK